MNTNTSSSTSLEIPSGGNTKSAIDDTASVTSMGSSSNGDVIG
jgi:hypothetical protein